MKKYLTKLTTISFITIFLFLTACQTNNTQTEANKLVTEMEQLVDSVSHETTQKTDSLWKVADRQYDSLLKRTNRLGDSIDATSKRKLEKLSMEYDSVKNDWVVISLRTEVETSIDNVSTWLSSLENKTEREIKENWNELEAEFQEQSQELEEAMNQASDSIKTEWNQLKERFESLSKS